MEVGTTYAKTIDDYHVAYQLLGRGEIDLLLTTRYFTNLETDWAHPLAARVRRSLAEVGRLILFDGRGTGLSDPVPHSRLPTLEERSDDIRAVLDAAGSTRAVIISMADSGPLGCLFAATHPERIQALVLCNARPRTAWAPDYPWGMSDDEFRQELESIGTRWGTRSFAAEIAAEVRPDLADDAEWIDYWATSMRQSASPRTAADLLRMYFAMDVRDVLSAIQVPTLVLAGETIADEQRAFAQSIPGAELTLVHGDTPLFIARPDAYIEEIRRFLARLRDDEAALDRVLATVLFTDIVGSTERAASSGQRAWTGLLERHNALVRGMLARWRGHEIDTAGDGFFASFDGPARAIRCAQAIVAGVSQMGIEVRAGLHTGECELVDGKMGGLTVAIGARVAALAGPSEVVVSQTVKDLVVGSQIPFEDAGEHVLKGVPGRWRLYRVTTGG